MPTISWPPSRSPHAISPIGHAASPSCAKRSASGASDRTIIDQVIERFSELGYLDDADFARRWIQTREQLAPRGTRLLKQELRQKGIDADLADEALADADLDELETATRIAERRLPKMTGLDRDTQRRRLAGYLERRGFSHDIVRQIDRKYFRES